MKIGIVCYASVGGSGIVATELGKMLALHGHQVHVLSGDTPVRLGDYQPGLSFHRVEPPSYPLFREPQYLLALANKIVQVCKEERLDIVHAHYAIPHATAAYLARQILLSTPGETVPRVITTLHGTDITLMGADRSYSEIVKFGIEQSDGVTAVSASLKSDTHRELGVARDIRVIPNFIDTDTYQRRVVSGLCSRLAPEGEKLLIHVSNFRPVKRVMSVVEIFARVRRAVPARLLMVGDGPDLPAAAQRARSLDLGDSVQFLGEQDHVVPLLSSSDLFLLPSSQESFGLAALEAMACAVPVVASRVGGIPEVVEDNVTGFLHAPGDLEGMAASAIAVLTDEAMHRRLAAAARDMAFERYRATKIVPIYESYYEETLSQPSHDRRRKG
jgi:N-acetyl-alpha-D-glucosaminyl L-malate synthase BshA